MRGQLTIVPVEAFILTKPSSRLFTSQLDSYVKFRLGQRSVQSQKTKQKGINPFWEDVLLLKKGKSNILKIQLIDHHSFWANQSIGSAQVPLDGIVLSKNMNKQQIWLNKDGDITAKLAFEIFFEPEKIEEFQQLGQPGSLSKHMSTKSTNQHQRKQQTQSQSAEIPSIQSSPVKVQQFYQKIQEAKTSNPIPKPQQPSPKLNPQSAGKKVKKRILRIIQEQYTQKQKFTQAEMESPVCDYLAEGKFPDILNTRIGNFCQISIQQMKMYREEQEKWRNTLVSQVIHINEVIKNLDILKINDDHQVQAQEEEEQEVKALKEQVYEMTTRQQLPYDPKDYTEEQINRILFD